MADKMQKQMGILFILENINDKEMEDLVVVVHGEEDAAGRLYWSWLMEAELMWSDSICAAGPDCLICVTELRCETEMAREAGKGPVKGDVSRWTSARFSGKSQIFLI